MLYFEFSKDETLTLICKFKDFIILSYIFKQIIPDNQDLAEVIFLLL